MLPKNSGKTISLKFYGVPPNYEVLPIIKNIVDGTYY